MKLDIERLIAERRKSNGRNGPAQTNKSLHDKETQLSRLKISRGVTSHDRTTFLSQLSLMLRARVSLVRSLEILVEQTNNSKPALKRFNSGMKGVIVDVLNEVKKGSSFSTSLSHHPEVFDPLVVVTAEVGQESGRLPDVLSSLAEHMERMNALKKKVTQALAYPILVLSVALVVVLFLLLYIVPTFADMFRSS